MRTNEDKSQNKVAQAVNFPLQNLPSELVSYIISFLNSKTLAHMALTYKGAKSDMNFEFHAKAFKLKKITSQLEKLSKLIESSSKFSKSKLDKKREEFVKSMFRLLVIPYPNNKVQNHKELKQTVKETLLKNIELCNNEIEKGLNSLEVKEFIEYEHRFHITKHYTQGMSGIFTIALIPIITAAVILSASAIPPVILVIGAVLVAGILLTIPMMWGIKIINLKNKHDIKEDYRRLRNDMDEVKHRMEKTLAQLEEGERLQIQKDRTQVIKLLKTIFQKTNSTGIKKILLEINESKENISASRLFNLIQETCAERLEQSPNKVKFSLFAGRSDAAQQFYNAGKDLECDDKEVDKKEVPNQETREKFINKLKKIPKELNAPDNKENEAPTL